MHHPRDKQQHHPVLGIGFMLLSTLFFALSDVLGKWLTASFPITQIGFIRSIVGIIILFLMMLFTSRLSSLKTKRPIWHIFRSILCVAVVFAMYYGLKHLPLAEYVSLCFAIPFFIAIISPWFLREKVSIRSWVAIIIGFLGIVLILRPSPEHMHLAHLTTLLLAFTAAILAVSSRYLGATENFYSINFYLYPSSLIAFGFDSMSVWVTPHPVQLLALISLGISTTIALACYIQANRYARPAMVAPIDYARMVWTILLGYFIWQEVPDIYTWAGMMIIIGSGVFVVSQMGTVPEVDTAQSLDSEKKL